MDLVDLTRPMTPEGAVMLAGRRAVSGQLVHSVEVEWLRHWESGDNTAQATWKLSDHFGTHVDAPVHVIADGDSVDQMDLARLIGNAMVLDCSFGAHRGLNATDFERAYPGDHNGEILLIHAGEPAGTPNEYLVDQTYVTEDGAQWIVDHGFHAVGVEWSCLEHAYERIVRDHLLDAGVDDPWPAHRICLAADVYIIEGLTNLKSLVGEHVQFVAAPLPVPRSSGSPVRAFAWRATS